MEHMSVTPVVGDCPPQLNTPKLSGSIFHSSPSSSSSTTVFLHQTHAAEFACFDLADPFGLMTFAYKQALQNRISLDKIGRGRRLDIQKWDPVFVYDILQFPGSLANALSQSSSMDIIPYMTPAKMKRYVVCPDRKGEPLLCLTGRDDDSVQGMMVFGRGGKNRRSLAAHHGDGFQRKRRAVEVVFEGGEVCTLATYVWVHECGINAKHSPNDSDSDTIDAQSPNITSEPNDNVTDQLDGSLTETERICTHEPGEYGDSSQPWSWLTWKLEQYILGQYNDIEW